ncbi:hypothetical protein CK203_100224 [Vitis vinifera]|uniref:Uncharacterized protein n=1 Tax=Vitis vinifera TaxID=29760 RepID=A0A438CRD4_VITVI|nr:hypothetical protein CK203_100224 [Vitis vinifera]
MGASPNPPASARDLKGMVLQNRAKRRQWRKRSIRGGTQRRILLKRRAVLEGSRRLRSDGVMRRVRTLKSLVPNGNPWAWTASSQRQLITSCGCK